MVEQVSKKTIGENINCCEECNGKIVEDNHKYICGSCGLVLGESSSFYDGAPMRASRARSEGFIKQTSSDLYKGSNIYPTDASLNREKWGRLGNMQKKSNQVNNLARVRKAKKKNDNVQGAELAFRKISLPQDLKEQVFRLFMHAATKLNFPASKAPLYAAACAWYYTDKECISKITIHSIVRGLDSVKGNKCDLRGAPRLLYGKLNALRNLIMNGRIKIMGRGIIRTTLNDLIVNDIYRTDKGTLPGIEYVEKILNTSEMSDDEILDNILACIEEIKSSYGRVSNRLNKKISQYRKEVETLFERTDPPSINRHIMKHLESMSVITDLQKKMLQITANKLLDLLQPISGKSRHAVSATLIYLALLYHGIKINLAEYAPIVNTSKSTISFRTKEIEEELGFKKGKLGDFGYLVPTSSKSGLLQLGKSFLFTDSHDELKEEAFIMLKKIIKSYKSAPEYAIARAYVIKLLLDQGEMTLNDIKNTLKKITRNSERSPYIVWHTINFFKDRGNSLTNIVKKDGSNIGIQDRLKEGLIECFSIFNVISSKDVLARFQRDRCFIAVRRALSLINMRDVSTSNLTGKPLSKKSIIEEMPQLIITMRTNNNKTYSQIIAKIKETFGIDKSRGYVYKVLKDHDLIKKKITEEPDVDASELLINGQSNEDEESKEHEIIALRKQRKKYKEIAELTNTTITLVYNTLKEANMVESRRRR